MANSTETQIAQPVDKAQAAGIDVAPPANLDQYRLAACPIEAKLIPPLPSPLPKASAIMSLDEKDLPDGKLITVSSGDRYKGELKLDDQNNPVSISRSVADQSGEHKDLKDEASKGDIKQQQLDGGDREISFGQGDFAEKVTIDKAGNVKKWGDADGTGSVEFDGDKHVTKVVASGTTMTFDPQGLMTSLDTNASGLHINLSSKDGGINSLLALDMGDKTLYIQQKGGVTKDCYEK